MKTKSLRFLLLMALCFSLFTPSTLVHAGGILYAKSTASGTGDCLSWANACTLQSALTMAISGDEIWVAAGTYKPTTVVTERTATFQLKEDVAVYGGFAGTESTRNERNIGSNTTILSGDLNSDDLGFTNNSENAYHVVIGATGATLDGFTITAGNADDTYDTSLGCGGGMFNPSNTSPTLVNLTFSGNKARFGGGLYHWSGSPTLTNVTFSNNLATIYGGGMEIDGGAPSLTNVTFTGNSAGSLGGGLFNASGPTLTNVTFSGNSADYGGGMHNESWMYRFIQNTIFWGNTAIRGGAQVNNTSGYTVISDSVIEGGCPEGSLICTNIINTDPLLGALGDYGGSTQVFPLLQGSSAINTGNDAVCPATDQRGMVRPQGVHCDIGAFEVEIFSVYLPMLLKP